jgi:PAS domain S-box-containing protein
MGPDLRFSWFSDGASAAIGKTRPENSGDPADTPAWRDHLADLEARRPFKDFRYTGRDQHGTEICASVSGVPIFDTEGAFLGYRGTATDITAEVRAEQRAAQAQAMLVDAIESIADGFSMFDRDDRLILVNQHHRRALAAIADLAVPGVPWETLLRAQVDRGLVKVPVEDRKTWIQEQLAEHRRGDAVRVHETLDGRWVEIRDYRTRDGGWVIVRADITALKRAEAARKESEQRFKDFAEATSDWFWEMGSDLRFTWFSHRLLKGTGLYTRKLIGKTRRMLGRSDTDARKWRAHIAKLNARRPFRDFRYRIRNDAGKDVFLSISGVPIFGPDNIFVGYRGTGKNITAEVLAEQRAAQAQAFLTDAIESIREGFAMFDKQDRLVLSNESFRKSLSAIADVLRPGMPWKTGFLAMVKRGVV